MTHHRIRTPSNLNQFLIDIGKEVIAYRLTLTENAVPEGFRRVTSQTRPLDAAHVWRLLYNRDLSNIARIARRALAPGVDPRASLQADIIDNDFGNVALFIRTCQPRYFIDVLNLSGLLSNEDLRKFLRLLQQMPV